jgi:hypothetical protein
MLLARSDLQRATLFQRSGGVTDGMNGADASALDDEKRSLVRRSGEALARRELFRRSGRFALGGAVSAWLLGVPLGQRAEAHPSESPHCSDFSASGYSCYGRICKRYGANGQTCQAREADCNGGGQQCWNTGPYCQKVRHCDYWVYPPGPRRKCHCDQYWGCGA